MAIDFEIPPEAKAVRERVRQWVHDECIPAEKRLADGEEHLHNAEDQPVFVSREIATFADEVHRRSDTPANSAVR